MTWRSEVKIKIDAVNTFKGVVLLMLSQASSNSYHVCKTNVQLTLI